MESIKTITKIGNSYGVIIPDAMLKEVGLKKQKKVKITSHAGLIQIELAEGREGKVMRIVAKYIKKYRSDFEKLAR